MTPHVDNPFTGHMPEGDPRDLMWACGGCHLPTVMAHNYLLCSTNAWGALEHLNTHGIQLQPNIPVGSSWEFYWKLNGGYPWVYSAFLRKRYPINGDNYELEVAVSGAWGFWLSTTIVPSQACNVTHMLTPTTIGWPAPYGGTGDGFRLLQVEWDQTRPPGGWPP